MNSDLAPLRIVPGSHIDLLDQTRLPHEEGFIAIRDVAALCEAIRALRVRGAPLLGLAAACGMAIGATTRGPSDTALRATYNELVATRPTAVDLAACAQDALTMALALPEGERNAALWRFAEGLAAKRAEEDAAIGANGAALIPEGAAVLTHCNAGGLATGGIGTALGVVWTAFAQGRAVRCYATETRPLLQGARLTAWELTRAGIPATLLPDSAVASLLGSGAVQVVVTGADRIAANGDSANKIGTAQIALAAAAYGVPFYIAAPLTTVDLACPDGSRIPIEFRDGGEVGGFDGARWAPDGIDTYNPAFDVTPARLIAAIVTERGVVRPPFGAGLAALAARAEGERPVH